jgi:PDZ domain-containing protein
VPAGDIVAPCASSAQAEAAALQEMSFSQRVAAAVALRRLGYHVVVKPTGVVVSQLIAGTHAPCNLQPMDVVVSVDGKPTPTEGSLHAALGQVQPGAVVKLRVLRGGRTLTVPVQTVPAGGRALVGFVPDQSAKIKLPIRVAIDSSGIGGPSAGLAFTLEVMQKLGRNVLHGHRVAATGEIELSGAVGPIGGIKQKTYGVRQAGADVFLVPAGQNARDARRYAGPVRIIPVHNLSQALRALATLPRA